MTNPPDPYGQQPQYGQQPDPYSQPNPSSGQPADYQQQQPGYPPQPAGYQQSSYPQQPAGYPGYQPPPPSPSTNMMAILALVFAFVFAPAAIVLGHIAKKQIAERQEGGSGLATAGLVLGYVFTGLWVLSCCGFIGLAVLAESANTSSSSF